MDQPRQHTSRTAENLNYVDRLVASTGCDIEPINVTQSGDDAAETSASDRDAVATKDNPSKTRLARPALALAIFLPIFAGVGTAGATQFLRGRAPTIGRAKRMFRRPVIIPVLVSKQNNAPEMAGAVDISRGGVKLLWKREALLEERPVCRRSSRHWFWRD
ncbi:hypothetical protein [uncultured Boseongicola sp.]|uniref:hypothetical protein n=1 Tax=uncultured Boseongicola sp. TaxID=1648499 RepID=UPI0026117CA5|nr:hypothetical protein [uncultured Boseongicola sp.]